MKKNPQQLNKRKNRWQVVDGIVDTSRDYIRVTYSDYEVPYALLGLSRYRTIIVQYFCGDKSWKNVVHQALDNIRSEIKYYLLERESTNPWKALVESAGMGVGRNSKIYWVLFPCGNHIQEHDQENRQWDEQKIPLGPSEAKLEADHCIAMAQYDKGKALLDINDLEEALTAFNRAIEIEVNHSDWYLSRGVALRRMARMNRALQDFSTAIEINPNSDFAYSSRGFCYYLKNKYKEALADCDKTLELAPNECAYYSNRGCVHREMGELEKALCDYDKAIELAPDDTLYFEYRAETLIQMGKLDLARESIEEVLRIDPFDIQAFATQAQIKSGVIQN